MSINSNESVEVVVDKETILLNNINYKYKESNNYNLSNINLEINKGEFILLTGESGCGKTTLTRCLNGLLTNFYEGEINGEAYVEGMNVEESSIREVSEKVGSVFQDPRSQFFTLHVKTEVVFSSENFGFKRSDIKKNVVNTINNLNLNNLLDKSIFELSSGEKQKVAVAAICAAKPKIFILDEPSANLDGKGTKQLGELLKLLKEKGHTIIISEHKLYYLKDLIDRVVLMKKGKIAEIIDRDSFLKKNDSWFEEKGLRHINLNKFILKKELQEARKRKQGKLLMEVCDLAFGYNRKENLWQNLSFKAYSGEIIGITGRNGVGKSTLIRILMGLEKQKNGQILINGERASAKERRKNSFYVVQDVDYQLFAPSVFEEMFVGLKKNKENEEKAEKYLKLFSLEEFKEKHPTSLSGGQKQRLAIALACMRNSKFLFLDEPTSGLDYKNMIRVSNIIKELANEGRCVFVISHDYEFAVSTFTSVIYFDENSNGAMTSSNEFSPNLLYSKIIE